MHVTRPVTLFVTAAVTAVVVGSVLGATTHSDATPAPGAAATTASTGNPKVPGARACCRLDFLRPGDRIASGGPDGSMQSGGLGPVLTFGAYDMRLEDDGNLVEYAMSPSGERAVWSTGIHSSTPTTLTFQSDGNIVLRNRAGQALWATGTAGRPVAYFDVYGNGQVVTQDSAGHVVSAYGRADVALPGIAVIGAVSPALNSSAATYRTLNVQHDGNLVEYVVSRATGAQRAVWSTGTSGAGPVTLSAQADGNLVLRQISTGRAVWASGAKGGSAYYQLDVQDDGNLVLYRTDGIRRVQAVWATGIRH